MLFLGIDFLLKSVDLLIFRSRRKWEFLRSENFGYADFGNFGRNDFLKSGRLKMIKNGIQNYFLCHQKIVLLSILIKS
jgi:hypothetical protein